MKEKIKSFDFKNFVSKNTVPIVFVLMCSVFAIMSENFLRISNAITVLRQISMLCIMASGVIFVMLSGGIDLSVGSIASLSGVFWALALVNGLPEWVALMIALATGLIVGFLNGILVTSTKMNPMIATLGTGTILGGVAYLICNGGKPIYGLPETAKFLGQGYILKLPVPVWIMILCLVINAIILKKTYFGRAFYASGSNEEAARLSGINTSGIKTLAFSMSGLFAALAGCIMMSRVYSGQPAAGASYMMDVLTACIVGGVSIGGGIGSTINVLIGSLIVGVINNGLTIIRVSEYWQQILRGAILIFAVAIDAIQRSRGEKAKKSIKH